MYNIYACTYIHMHTSTHTMHCEFYKWDMKSTIFFLNLFHDFIKFNLLNKHLIYGSHCYMFLGLNHDLKNKKPSKQACLSWERQQRDHTACTGTCVPRTACWKWVSAPGKETQVRCQEALSASSIHKIPYIPLESIKDKLLISQNLRRDCLELWEYVMNIR